MTADRPEITVDEIMKKIREEVARRKVSGEISDRSPDRAVSPYVLTEVRVKSKYLNELLWKYGTRYAKIIKRIPVLKELAEKHYWRLASRNLSTAGTEIDKIGTGYGVFIEEARKEGVKGRIKLFIFKLIGFFAWWQEQINSAIYGELLDQRRREVERERRVSVEIESFSKSIRTITTELAELKQALDGMNTEVTLVSKTEDALYAEMADLREEIDKRGGNVREEIDKLNEKIHDALKHTKNIK